MTKSENTKAGDSPTEPVPKKAVRETLVALYNPLIHAAVQTRRDADQIMFQYIAIFVAIITVLASEHFELIRTTFTQVGATLVVVAIFFIALMTLLKRVDIFRLLFYNLLRIESALGVFSPSARKVYDPAVNLTEGALFHDDWSTRKEKLAKGQHWPHKIGLTLIAIVTIAMIWSF